jgi:hypothetical protein
MSTGSFVINQLANATVVPTIGTGSTCNVSFGGSQVLQAVPNLYLEVILKDPTNVGAPATFEVEIVGGIQTANNVLGTITTPGLTTIQTSSPITFWQANLVSLSGGTAPSISVNGVAAE